MRILHLISSPGAGGAESLARDLAIEQVSVGDQCVIVFMSSLEGIARDPLYGQDFLAQLDAHNIPHALIGAGRNPLIGARKLRRIMSQFRPDVLQAHLGSGVVIAGLACTGVPIIYTHHASFFPFSPRWMWAFNRIVSAYVGVCAASADVLRPLARRPVKVIHNGRRSRSASTAQPPLPGKPFRVLTVGSFVVEKDYPSLVEVVGHCERANPGGLLFSIAGDGPLKGEIEALAEERGLAHRIEFLGARTDVQALMASYHALLSTSATEAFPMSMIEALQAGLPIVGTRVGSVDELVETGANGFLEQAGAAEAIAERLVEIASSAELWSQFSNAALARARNFDIERCRQDYAQVYAEVATGRGAVGAARSG